MSGGIWDHYAGWWARRGDENVLWVCYEDLKQDAPREIARIAKFMGVSSDPGKVALVAAKTNIKAMAHDGSKYGDDFARARRRMRVGALSPPVEEATSFVREPLDAKHGRRRRLRARPIPRRAPP